MVSPFDPQALDRENVHVVRLGSLLPHESGANFIVTDQPGTMGRSFVVDDLAHAFLKTLDPAETDREFTPWEREVLRTFAEKRAVSFYVDGDDLTMLEFVAVPRRVWGEVLELEEGYEVRIDDTDTLFVSDLVAFFVPHLHKRQTLGETAQLVLEELSSTDEGRLAIHELTAEEGHSIENILAYHALYLASDMVAVGAATVEPVA